MDFITNSDNRNGKIIADNGDDRRSDGYSVQPGEDQFLKVKRELQAKVEGADNRIEVAMSTESEFIDMSASRCNGLRFDSKASIAITGKPQSGSSATVQELIALGFRIETPLKVRLQASVLCDTDAAIITLSGPGIAAGSMEGRGTPGVVRVFDDVDDVFFLGRAGEYVLKGAYFLILRDKTLTAGRPLEVQITAKLTRAD